MLKFERQNLTDSQLCTLLQQQEAASAGSVTSLQLQGNRLQFSNQVRLNFIASKLSLTQGLLVHANPTILRRNPCCKWCWSDYPS